MATNFNSLEDAALVTALLQHQHDVVTARFKLAAGRLENTASISVLRKDIAKMKTELRKREIAQGLLKDALIAAHGKGFTPDRKAAAPAAEAGAFLQDVVDDLAQ